MSVLAAERLQLGFGSRVVLDNLHLQISQGDVLSILGPNGSGKSTLLKGLSRLLPPLGGIIYLNGRDIQQQSSRLVARQLAVLPQTHQAPGDVTVRELVEYGRFPHQKWWRGPSREDDAIITLAMAQTGVAEFADRPVLTLSGGELQRAWMAMAIAQKPATLLLDEPTTYLDIAHQLEIMELVSALNREQGITVVMVLHDINHAARYSKRILVLNRGALFALGTPAEVINREMLDEVFGVDAAILSDPDGVPVFITRGLYPKAKAGGLRPSKLRHFSANNCIKRDRCRKGLIGWASDLSALAAD
ncbi:ABC transporter ATP-binding protein [Acetonema longum]|uniref:FhuC n=1 Tax=Acetonema longum DSM 6540 TaxID=1009370 RepID=F7NPT0_9FIRM|nr:ABC transporter ATP-binding protein [Acetonema longum]EGO61921.1 FhuC [Acetonema longum DSM 6540]